MGGATFQLPEKDRTLYTKKYCLAMLRICFGGRVAEEMFCDDISSGAAADIRQATEIAKRMVTDWGMSDKVGFVYYGEDGRNGWFEIGRQPRLQRRDGVSDRHRRCKVLWTGTDGHAQDTG